ncbi:MAG: sugar phosphate isomerase/epimerase [Anaerolineae bacterium]|nr:sugar phosphate isomerase/epimerase [Anaerolineae bacterium]
MQLAMRASRLPGSTFAEKIANAHAAGLDGVEFEVEAGFYDQLGDISEALQHTGLRAAAIYLGHTTLVHPDYAQREAARVAVRQALGAAVDLGAAGVTFYGHYSRTHVLPDLHPYKSAVELEAELLSTELRATLCDLAYAMGKKLFLLHAHAGETALLRRLEHAVKMRLVQNEHPFLWAAASVHHMAMQGEMLTDTLRAHLPHVGHVYVGDHGQRWPGAEGRDLSPIAHLLNEAHYGGWVVIEGQDPTPIPAPYLAPMVGLVRDFGF